MGLREATEEDAGEIHALVAELAGTLGDVRPEPGAVRERLAELLEERRAEVVVAEGPKGVVGVVSLWVKPDLAHGDVVVEVPMLVVSQEARRRGVGKLLMAEAQRIAARNDANLIELVATSSNVAARDFYRSLGFVETDHVALEFMGNLEDPPDPDEQ